MTTTPHETLLACAEETARTAGRHALQNIARSREIQQRLDHDVKLRLDRECQDVAENIIRKHFPQHEILGEEGSLPGTDPHYRWVVDPIDGTINYFHGLDLWCCSIAIQHNDITVAAAVYMPVQDWCFTATLHGPALCNGQPLTLATTSNLQEAIFLYGLGKPTEGLTKPVQTLMRVSNKVQVPRILGAAAVDICLVAAGKADIYFDHGIYLWDVAAAGLIAQRAGAKLEIIPANEAGQLQVLCAIPTLFDPIRDIISEK